MQSLRLSPWHWHRSWQRTIWHHRPSIDDGSGFLLRSHVFVGHDLEDILGNSSHMAHAVLPRGELSAHLLFGPNSGTVVGSVPFLPIGIQLIDGSNLLLTSHVRVAPDPADHIGVVAHLPSALSKGGELSIFSEEIDLGILVFLITFAVG